MLHRNFCWLEENLRLFEVVVFIKVKILLSPNNRDLLRRPSPRAKISSSSVACLILEMCHKQAAPGTTAMTLRPGAPHHRRRRREDQGVATLPPNPPVSEHQSLKSTRKRRTIGQYH